MNSRTRCLALVVALLAGAASTAAQTKRKVIIDQDARGPATTDQQAILVLVQSLQTEVLGITVVSGDAWRDEEVAHTLRTLEVIGRTDIPVVPGAVYPLLNSQEEAKRWETLYGKLEYKGAWNEPRKSGRPAEQGRNRILGPFEVPRLPEGAPTTKAANEDAPHFLSRMVHQYPHEVSIVALGPLTDLALAIALDPDFPFLAKELVIMGGSIGAVDELYKQLPGRHEFNFWWDPEAARIVLRARWPKITVTTADISMKTRLTKEMIAEIGKSQASAAQYLAKWSDEEYMWDELAAAAWLDPAIITNQQQLFLDVNIDHGAGYGDTLVWRPGMQPGVGERQVNVQIDLDKDKFYKMFVDLMTHAAPGAKSPQ
jgi:purine nucleosidase